MRRAWVIAAATLVIAACCACSRTKGQLVPAQVPCGYRAVNTAAFALAVPLYWEQKSVKKQGASSPQETQLFFLGGAAGVGVTTERWIGAPGDWKNERLARLKRDHYELVEARPLPALGEDAVLVEDRFWETRLQTQWHDWRAFVFAGGVGLQLACRVEESDVKTLEQVCLAIIDSFAVAR